MSEKEEAVLAAATRLFSAYGYHAVGVDTIVTESNVAKMTFYKYFPSKEDLIERVLARRDQNLRESMTAAIGRARTPMRKLKAIFDWHDGWFRSPDFHGCMFIKASEEFPRPGSGARLVAQAHKTWLAELLENILLELGVSSPKQLSMHVMVVLDGLTVKLNMYDDSVAGQVRAAWRYTKQLVEQSTAKAG
jgi:AcrR family transcriptional regulator